VFKQEETLRIKSGSCRDFAWLLIHVLRHFGLAARFVSGYIVQLSPDVKSLDGPSGPEKILQIYMPGLKFIYQVRGGLDLIPLLAFASEGHIPLCCTPHYESAAPVTGATEKCEVSFGFENTVTRIHEDPRVTKPYSDKQWEDIMQVGNDVEKDLIEGDVR
jgi:transglutaminase-like putative cysteine protease